MKKMILLMTLCLTGTMNRAYAYDWWENGVYYNISGGAVIGGQLVGALASVTSGSYSGAVVIPNSFNYANNGLFGIVNVRSIEANAFKNRTGVTSVTIQTSGAGETSIRTIGENAFDGCTGLTSISIPYGVTSIGNSAFSGCTNLQTVSLGRSGKFLDFTFEGCGKLHTINIDASNTSQTSENGIVYSKDKTSLQIYPPGKPETAFTIPAGVTTIGWGAFVTCNNLRSVIIPDGVTKIDGSAFYHCSNLTSVNIPSGVTAIERFAFAGCSSLTQLVIPQSVLSIGSSAFENCTSLTSVSLLANLSQIEGWTFYGCSSLKSLTIPNGVTSIGHAAIYGCSSLTSLILPESLTIIGDYSINRCSSLKSLDIPKNVTSIGIYGLCNTGLTSITIPDKVTTLYKGVFYGSSNLKTVEVEWNTPLISSNDSILFHEIDLSAVRLVVPNGAKALYGAAEVWKDFGNIIEKSQLAIPTIPAETQAYISNHILFLNTPVSEIVLIYSLDGKLLHNTIKPAGEAQIPLEGINEKILIVKCGTSRAKKFVSP